MKVLKNQFYSLLKNKKIEINYNFKKNNEKIIFLFKNNIFFI